MRIHLLVRQIQIAGLQMDAVGRAMQIAGWPLPLLSFVSFAIIVIGLLKLKKGPAHG